MLPSLTSTKSMNSKVTILTLAVVANLTKEKKARDLNSFVMITLRITSKTTFTLR